jgi:hypothetical protein
MGKNKTIKSDLFPDIDIFCYSPLKPYINNWPTAQANLTNPFDIQTGTVLVGEHKGKTLDELFRENPGYVMRWLYYWNRVWPNDHKAAFLYWTKNIDFLE